MCVGFKGEMGVVEGDTDVCVEREFGVVDGEMERLWREKRGYV